MDAAHVFPPAPFDNTHFFSFLGYVASQIDVEGGPANLAMAKKVTISKKSAIFVLSPWNLVKITKSWGSHFDQVSWG